jgi:hypothetical protein
MNPWINLSIEYACQRSYLDDLFKVYPTIPEGIRNIDDELWKKVERAFKKKDNADLLEHLLKFELFPIKDSYVAYLKRDNGSINRNPRTVDRICGRLYEMGLEEIFSRSTEPKETNRQIGPLFRRWLNKGVLGVKSLNSEEFISTEENAILDGGDAELARFACERLNYKRDKGLDLVARFNRQYVIGEAKFLTDFGGHQKAQFNDAVSIFKGSGVDAVKIAILDGVLYIEGGNAMHRSITKTLNKENIMSSLVLREFLYQV